jgi:hypothetical protein
VASKHREQITADMEDEKAERNRRSLTQLAKVYQLELLYDEALLRQRVSTNSY